MRNLTGEDELTTFSYSAVARADGTAQGEYEYHFRAADFLIHGTVTCASVAGNAGWVGGIIDSIGVASVAAPAQRSGQQPDPLAYVEARTDTMQADASPTAIDEVLQLVTDDVVYEHPAAGIRLQGKEAIASGMRRFAGTTRRARSEIRSMINVTSATAVEEVEHWQSQ